MNLVQAVRLYRFVKPHLPENTDKLQISEYLYKIVGSIRTTGNTGDFAKFFTLCTGKKSTKGLSSEEVTMLLAKALLDVNLEELRGFLEGIKNG